MTADHLDDIITTLIERVPFQVFKVELNTGEQVEIDHSRAIIVRDGRAVFLDFLDVCFVSPTPVPQ